jgi:hypothetical protein
MKLERVNNDYLCLKLEFHLNPFLTNDGFTLTKLEPLQLFQLVDITFQALFMSQIFHFQKYFPSVVNARSFSLSFLLVT